ncbi:MAG: hypothetical protein ABI980_10710 [Nitrospirota bacterium]
MEIPEVVVRWSRGQEFAVETVAIEPHTQGRLAHCVERLVKDSPVNNKPSLVWSCVLEHAV